MACWSSAERILIYVLASHPREHENSSVPSLFCWLRACRKPVAWVNDSGKSSQSQRPSLGSQNEARIRPSSITPFSWPTVSLKLMAHPLAKNSSSGANRITHDEELQSTPRHISSSAGSKSRSSKRCNNSSRVYVLLSRHTQTVGITKRCAGTKERAPFAIHASCKWRRPDEGALVVAP